jgi:hypothetical protein
MKHPIPAYTVSPPLWRDQAPFLEDARSPVPLAWGLVLALGVGINLLALYGAYCL